MRVEEQVLRNIRRLLCYNINNRIRDGDKMKIGDTVQLKSMKSSAQT